MAGVVPYNGSMENCVRIPAGTPDLEEHWDPQIYCGPGAAIALATAERMSIREMGGTCVEGERTELKLEDADGNGSRATD